MSFLLWTMAAMGQELSLDIELLRPTFSLGLPGVDSAQISRAGTIRGGFYLQYEREPLVLYEFDERVGAIIENRFVLHAGASADINRRVSIRASLPLINDVGTLVPEFANPGFGAGDLAMGARVAFLIQGPFRVGARTDFLLPTGRDEAWQGDRAFRVHPGLLASVDLGAVDIYTDLGAMVRPITTTDLDFTAGPEIVGNGGVSLEVVPGWANAWTGVYSRYGLVREGTSGEAETIAEVAAGLTLFPLRWLQTDLFFGKGVTQGFGTDPFRVGLGVTMATVQKIERPPPPPPEPKTLIPPPEPPPVPVVLEDKPPAPVVWEEEQLAQIVEDQIVIRDPIQFEFGTDVILPVSLPTLQQVGDLLQQHGELLHIVIEGHASEEGSDIYNFDLSMRRTTAIYKALIDAGVHPSRISCRSMGETRPLTTNTDEASLAANRRVEFHIVARMDAADPPPNYFQPVRKPWSGEPARIVEPVYPPPPPTKPEPKPDNPDFFKEKGEE